MSTLLSVFFVQYFKDPTNTSLGLCSICFLTCPTVVSQGPVMFNKVYWQPVLLYYEPTADISCVLNYLYLCAYTPGYVWQLLCISSVEVNVFTITI